MTALVLTEPEEPSVALPRLVIVCTAETAECTCPDWCERDHGNE
jgi:hypothetical protein